MAEAAEPSPERENTYVIDAENAAEMARLMRQEQIVTAGMGGIFPEQSDLSEIRHVLDLACGPGNRSESARCRQGRGSARPRARDPGSDTALTCARETQRDR